MDEVRLENFRCFREQQTARLAPLTLLVGENSTGKTSFLAMVRALNAIFAGKWEYNFKDEPYDLGSFDEIAHHRGGRGGRAAEFAAGFSGSHVLRGSKSNRIALPYKMDLEFVRQGTVPVLRYRQWQSERAWISERFDPDKVEFGEGLDVWTWQTNSGLEGDDEDRNPPPLALWGWSTFLRDIRSGEDILPESDGKPTPTPRQIRRIERLVRVARWGGRSPLAYGGPLFAAAPVRSKPHRTYDPSPYAFDSEGSYVPMYLADIFFRERKAWESMKTSLEKFGQDSGLFDEINIKPLGRRDSEPFQVQIRKASATAKGPNRNFIDVGYGVSQALPILTELFRKDSAKTFLLQQPEVHLHPSAQAALGTLFCQLASQGRQLLVETHSDHLIDRIRMDVRDGTTKLKPENVSILYFERGNIDVRIHSLRIDQEGNIRGAPDSYRQFFMAETRRSINL
ncbi:MAG: AAA family ATPase [Gammaproteobacteria bacterium]|nr:AAA family ATPase [Gammaproteobacteria bacterium]MDE0270024.1 AAA family ATPase [Gammaproteobacteria bacterium]